MAWYEIGKSSYGDLYGAMQYVNSARIAAQFLSLARDFSKSSFGADGDRLSPNEARRTRPRQTLLYRNFLTTGYPVAAVPFTSRHDEVNHGNAIDVGVTTKDGRNRALTDAEFVWMHAWAEKRGFTWTGRYFNEPWHIEGATRAEVIPPYAGITLANVYETPETPKPEPELIIGDDEMKIIWATDHKSALGILGSKTMKFRPGMGTLGADKLEWEDQAKLFEAACRVNVNVAWPGDKSFNPSQTDMLAQLITRFK